MFLNQSVKRCRKTIHAYRIFFLGGGAVGLASVDPRTEIG